jgi:hypothetical protein
MRKSLTIAAFAASAIGFLAMTCGAPAATPMADTEPPAAQPGHAPPHRSADTITLPPGAKAYESGKVNPNLTEQECGVLGGSVGNYSACLSGRVCTTTDESGNWHSVCISRTNAS